MGEPADLVAAVGFLSALKENNHRGWFEANRPLYEHARAQFGVLVTRLLSALAAEEDLGDLSPRDCVMRIHTDTRFSRFRPPYKTGFSALMAKGGRRSSRVGYYVHLEAGATLVGGGLWEPTPAQLARYREAVARDAAPLREILARPALRQHFGGLVGAAVKTAPRGWPRDHPDIDLLRYKQVAVMQRFADEALRDPALPETMAESLRVISPLIRWLNDALHGDP